MLHYSSLSTDLNFVSSPRVAQVEDLADCWIGRQGDPVLNHARLVPSLSLLIEMERLNRISVLDPSSGFAESPLKHSCLNTDTVAATIAKVDHEQCLVQSCSMCHLKGENYS